MSGPYPALDFGGIRTFSIRERPHKVHLKDVLPAEGLASLHLPAAPQPLKDLADDMRRGRGARKPIILMMGAHSVKVGLSRILRRFIEEGWVQHLAMNGAGPIHDFELSTFGMTSEEVADSLPDGRFGMVEETLLEINEAVRRGARKGTGYGQAVAEYMKERNPQHVSVSVIEAAYEMGIPITVHAAIGTDTIYQSPHCDGAAIGQTSYLDFRILAESVSHIGGGGVVINLGSSVILPEVFVKALSVARNLRGPIEDFTTAVFDMIDHYRPRVNVLQRPTKDKGRSLFVQGRFEVTVPQLAREIFAS